MEHTIERRAFLGALPGLAALAPESVPVTVQRLAHTSSETCMKSRMALPPITDDPRAAKGESRLVRRFPVYREGDMLRADKVVEY